LLTPDIIDIGGFYFNIVTLVAYFNNMARFQFIGLVGLLGLAVSCSKTDTEAPIIMLNPTLDAIHYRTVPYVEQGFEIVDNYSCNLNDAVVIDGFVDVNRYGTYELTYTIADEAENSATATRLVDIVLPIEDYYLLNWNAYDTCTSGNYFYTGLIQDCDCDAFAVTAGNISNFSLSAAFNLPISGNYNQLLTLDTTKAAVTFLGTATMSPAADSIYWNYTIADSISTDVCRSVWIKM
jgi:hypothetical protein